MGDKDSSGCNCSCGGCLSALVIGTVIIGTVALGPRNAWNKVKSTWDYDNQLQAVHRAMDKNNNGVLDREEELRMYKQLRIPTIEGEKPAVKIPYDALLKFNKKYNQEF